MKQEERDWRSYNEQLVMRGEILFDLDVLKHWQSELDEMNQDKQGWMINPRPLQSKGCVLRTRLLYHWDEKADTDSLSFS